uniref:Lectin-like domain-containing protein n=1 Tax=Eubacterium cellulosolvens (strain ATCC 43171 / JCM 9499 / 6) TaxID=633697 RepID=I5AUY6_EUBC6
MKKKLLTLLLVASTISSTLMPAQSVFADTTGDADVSIEETASDDQASTTSGSKKLFEEVTEEDYTKLANIKYGDIKYGNTTRKDIKSEVDLNDIEAKTVKDAYPISHEDIYIPDDKQTIDMAQFRKDEKERIDTSYNDAVQRHPDKKDKLVHPYANSKYLFSGYRYYFEISRAAHAFLESQQPAYSQETGDCSLNATAELVNKALISQNLITDIHTQRISRAQLEYNALYVTKDPLNGFHGDCSQNCEYNLQQKIKIVDDLKPHNKNDETDPMTIGLKKDLRHNNEYGSPIHSLYSGMGPVSEKNISDSLAYNICNKGTDEKNNYDLSTKDVYDKENIFARLTQCRIFPNPQDKNNSEDDKETIRNTMKAWIYKYGGVGFSGDSPEENYYNRKDNCVYSNREPGTKCHAMIIVGWDDTFPIDSFVTKDGVSHAKTKGAWLVKNSWNPFKSNQDIYGTEQVDESNNVNDYTMFTPFNYCRYYWLSYDTPCITSYFGIAFENKDYYDNIYQYDGYQKSIRPNTTPPKVADATDATTAANIFTIKNPDSESASDKAQELKCVGFEIYHNWGELRESPKRMNYPKYQDWKDPVKYKVEVYRNIPKGGLPTDGTLVNTSTTTGTCSNEGIYTVELNKPVSLSQGERFSVVVSLENTEKSNARIAVEENHSYLDAHREKHTGESYIINPSTNEWIDVVNTDAKNKNEAHEWPENVRIKAMTVNTNTDSSEIRTTPKPTTPTQSPITDCTKLEMKASVSGGYTGFECTVETEEESPLTDQIQYIDITKTDRQGAKKSSAFPLSQAKKVKTENGRIARSIFLAIAPSDYENTLKLEIRDNNYHPVKFLLSGDAANTCTTSYSTSLKEYLDKLKETAITNNDSATENFANALIIHMTCAQNLYKTKSNAESDFDLSVLDSIKAADFASYRLKRGTTGNASDTAPQIGLSFNWKKTNALSVIYYDVVDPSNIKSIQIDGEDITNTNPKAYQFEEIDDHHELTVNLSDIPISDFSKTHTITVEDTSGNQTVVKASVFSYIYSALKTNSTDQPIAKNYAKSLALLAKSYNQLDMSDTRYKDFFLF